MEKRYYNRVYIGVMFLSLVRVQRVDTRFSAIASSVSCDLIAMSFIE